MCERQSQVTVLARLFFIGACLIAACGGQAPTPAPSAAPPEPSIAAPTVAAEAEPVTLTVTRAGTFSISPVNVSSDEAVQHVLPLYESLVLLGTDGSIVPALAESWETDDYQTWTFHLRKGVVFHDGTPFNAEAVKYNFNRQFRVPAQSGGSYALYADENSAEVVDDYTIVFHLTLPFFNFLPDMGYYNRYAIASPTYLQANSSTSDADATEFMNTHECGTGPFKLVEFVPDQRIVYEEFPQYWGGVPGGKSPAHVDRLIFQVIKDPDTARVELEAGRVDIWDGPPPAHLEGLRQTPGVEVISFPDLRIAYLTMDVSKPPFDDVSVRRAIAYAINYEELRAAGELGTAFPQCGMIPDGVTDYLAGDPSLCMYPYDPVKARESLAQSAYPDGFTTDLIYTPLRNAGFDLEALLLQSYLAEIGITVNIQSMDPVTTQIARMAEGSYGLSLMSWSGPPNPDDFVGWYYDFGRLPPNDSWVGSFWLDEQVMSDMRAARDAVDPQQKKALYEGANRRAMEEAIYIPLFQGSHNVAIRDNVEGLLFKYGDLHISYVEKE